MPTGIAQRFFDNKGLAATSDWQARFKKDDAATPDERAWRRRLWRQNSATGGIQAV